MTSAVEVTTDLFEPELPKGPYAVIDPTTPAASRAPRIADNGPKARLKPAVAT